MRRKSTEEFRPIIAYLLLSLVFAALTPLAAPANAAPAQLAETIAKVDSLYQKRADVSFVTQTLKLLEPLEAGGEYEVLWRLARSYYWLGNKAKGKERLSLFERGRGVAEKAVEADKKGPDGYYWLAVLIGKIGLEKGILNSLASVKPMKAALEKVLSLDAKYADAYRVLAELYYKVPGWPLSIGDAKKAAMYAEEALKLKPDSVAYNRVAAEAYLKAKDTKSAKARLETVLRLPVWQEEPDEDREHKEWARAELKKL